MAIKLAWCDHAINPKLSAMHLGNAKMEHPRPWILFNESVLECTCNAQLRNWVMTNQITKPSRCKWARTWIGSRKCWKEIEWEMECWQSIQEWNVEHFVTCIRRPQHNTMGKHHDRLFSTSTTTHQWHQTRWQENLSLLDTVAFTKNDFKFYKLFLISHFVWPVDSNDFDVQIELQRNPAKSIPVKIEEQSVRNYCNTITLTPVNAENVI